MFQKTSRVMPPKSKTARTASAATKSKRALSPSSATAKQLQEVENLLTAAEKKNSPETVKKLAIVFQRAEESVHTRLCKAICSNKALEPQKILEMLLVLLQDGLIDRVSVGPFLMDWLTQNKITDYDVNARQRTLAVEVLIQLLSQCVENKRLIWDHGLIKKIFSCIIDCGDFEFQNLLVELLVRVNNKKSKAFAEKLENLFQEIKWPSCWSPSEALNAFLSINHAKFAPDCRKFLNELNNNSFSKGNSTHRPISIELEDVTYNGPQNCNVQLKSPDEGPIWLDFNRESITLLAQQGADESTASLIELNYSQDIISWTVKENVLRLSLYKPIDGLKNDGKNESDTKSSVTLCFKVNHDETVVKQLLEFHNVSRFKTSVSLESITCSSQPDMIVAATSKVSEVYNMPNFPNEFAAPNSKYRTPKQRRAKCEDNNQTYLSAKPDFNDLSPIQPVEEQHELPIEIMESPIKRRKTNQVETAKTKLTIDGNQGRDIINGFITSTQTLVDSGAVWDSANAKTPNVPSKRAQALPQSPKQEGKENLKSPIIENISKQTAKLFQAMETTGRGYFSLSQLLEKAESPPRNVSNLFTPQTATTGQNYDSWKTVPEASASAGMHGAQTNEKSRQKVRFGPDTLLYNYNDTDFWDKTPTASIGALKINQTTALPTPISANRNKHRTPFPSVKSPKKYSGDDSSMVSAFTELGHCIENELRHQDELYSINQHKFLEGLQQNLNSSIAEYCNQQKIQMDAHRQKCTETFMRINRGLSDRFQQLTKRSYRDWDR